MRTAIKKVFHNLFSPDKLSAQRRITLLALRSFLLLVIVFIMMSGILWKVEPSYAKPVPPSVDDSTPTPTSTDDGSSYTPSINDLEAISYAYVTGPGTATSGLPVLLDAYLNHTHDLWVFAESYAENTVHTDLVPEVGKEASILIHNSKINWNQNVASQELFLRLNGPATTYAIQVMGLSPFKNETPDEVNAYFETRTAESAQSLEGDGQVIKGSEGNVEIEGSAALACSFTPTTPVMTSHGEQAIGSLYQGEQVMAYNSRTGRTELQPIIQIITHTDADLVDLTLRFPSSTYQSGLPTQRTEVIHTNERHPFLTKEKGFTPVSEITPGTHIVRADGSTGVVTTRTVDSGSVTMYNLEVAADHTFVVGDGQFIVHNDCPTLRDGTAITLPADQIEHSFGRHAADWFGRATTNADRETWTNMINGALQSKQVFDWVIKDSSGPRATVAVLTTIQDGNQLRNFVVEFYSDTGGFATAFEPKGSQLTRMFQVLKIGGK
jgi:hypothetical protein